MRWGTHTLHDLVKQHGWKRGAEIGVYQGKTSFYLMDRCSDLTLYAVDSWPPDAQWCPPPAPKRDMRKIGERFLATAEGERYFDGRLIVLHGPSVEMAPRVEDGSLDFVFIDADHSTECVLSDIAAWAPKVRSGGMVLGHDIHLETVKDAVRQVYGEAYETYENDVWGIVKTLCEQDKRPIGRHDEPAKSIYEAPDGGLFIPPGDCVYWVGRDGEVWAANKDGGEVKVIRGKP